MIWIAGMMGGLGIACMIFKKTLIGILVGMQILALGTTMAFISAGVATELRMNAYIFGLFIILGSVVQLAVGYSLAIRLFFQKKNIFIESNKIRIFRS
jgi:NADH:ubiquinone oxidoreductase subunit K